jgi:hypothetical protein
MVVTHPADSVRAIDPADVRPTAARGVAMGALRRSLPWIGAAGVFLATFLFRVLEPGFDNDHFRMMAEGRQVLLAGEAPYRDFADPGIFLQIYTSAALQLLLGYNLFGQALFGTLVLSTAMALTFLLARRACGSTPIALVLTLLVIALAPRLKQHHVVFLPVLGLFVAWRYADRPTPWRLVVAGFATALAFLLRHDQGVYAGAAVGSVLVAMHWRDGARVLLGRIGLYGGVAAAALLPFFVFLQANGGIVEYFASATEYIQDEADRQEILPWPEFAIDPSDPLVTVELPPELPPAEIKIRWDEPVTPELRAELEQKYRLADPVPDVADKKGLTWEYELVDTSPENIEALVLDDAVDGTVGIDRKPYRPVGFPPEPFYVTWWREMPLLGLRILPGVLQPDNAVPWLYYVVVGVPILALLVLLRKRLRGDGPPAEVPTILSAALMCLLVSASLRDPLSDRLADVAAPPAIVAAWLLGQLLMGSRSLSTGTWGRHVVGGSHRAFRTGVAAAPRLARVGITASLIGLTALSVVSLSKVQQRIELAAILFQDGEIVEHALELFDDLRTSPPIEAPRELSAERRELVRYVRACTKPTDRLLVTWFAPEIYFYADRPFAGRQVFWFSDYYSSREDQAEIIESLRESSVPIIIRRLDRRNDSQVFEHVIDYVEQHYALPRGSKFASDSYQVLIDQRRTPTGQYEPLGLPCFS